MSATVQVSVGLAPEPYHEPDGRLAEDGDREAHALPAVDQRA
jgi:hypothetical protein